MWKRRQFGVLLRIAYDGRPFSGLAAQSNARTVAGTLQEAIATMAPDATALRVCSRTDAGVHAKEQFVAFQTDRDINSRGWVLGLAGVLPPEIAVLSAEKVDPGFEPCKCSLEKIYCYSVLEGVIPDPFEEGRSWRVFERLNHEKMRGAAALLVGTHDFRAFRGRGDVRTNTIRTIHSATLEPRPGDARILEIRLRGNAFLYHMVRIIAGTLVDVGRGRREPEALQKALQVGDRLLLGVTAPAAGLCLEHIELRQRGSDQWPYHLDGAPEVTASC